MNTSSSSSHTERKLCHALWELPTIYNYRFDERAGTALNRILLQSLVGFRDEYMTLLFPDGVSTDDPYSWNLLAAQGASGDHEYSEASRGQMCGHVFKASETLYRCRTCTDDETCVLCSKCFHSSDHEDHSFVISLSNGDGFGCCDCGDREAWIRPPNCTIHSELPATTQRPVSRLPGDVIESSRVTISRLLDYICDVSSCSLENARLPVSLPSVVADDQASQLDPSSYGQEYSQKPCHIYTLVLWNDEYHQFETVKDLLERHCPVTPAAAQAHAEETHIVGRTILSYSPDAKDLATKALKIRGSRPQLTVTVRAASHTFREAMCLNIIQWLEEISSCSVGLDQHLLRDTICKELLSSWRVGSAACRQKVGVEGLDDHARNDMSAYNAQPIAAYLGRIPVPAHLIQRVGFQPSRHPEVMNDGTPDIRGEGGDTNTTRWLLGSHSGLPTLADQSAPNLAVAQLFPIPRTPNTYVEFPHDTHPPSRHWLELPLRDGIDLDMSLAEDLSQRVRMEYLMLFEVRGWKKYRLALRELFISTLIRLPDYKRLLGIRWAGLKPIMAQLHVIADREPRLSILNLRVQILMTPSVTIEMVQRANFLTNSMAVLYTFMTRRQVGYPSNVNPRATVDLAGGYASSLRLRDCFNDVMYLLKTPAIQHLIRTELHYFLQYLDLAKLFQGVCPYRRVVGDHIEFEETDWIEGRFVLGPIKQLGSQFAECFSIKPGDDSSYLRQAIQSTTCLTMTYCVGAEDWRYGHIDIRHEPVFQTLAPFDFEPEQASALRIVQYDIGKEWMSFHHGLHNTLAHLLQHGSFLSSQDVKSILHIAARERLQAFPDKFGNLSNVTQRDIEDNILALFDTPIRVCAWLAQSRVGLWVRNGDLCGYQTIEYAIGASHRLDVFLIHVALAVCDPSTILATLINRFGLEGWVRGSYSEFGLDGAAPEQVFGIATDLVHLLIALLSDRAALRTVQEDPTPKETRLREKIIHTLCIKPLSYSHILREVSIDEPVPDDFDDLLRTMTNFHTPRGVSDSGMLGLKDEYLEYVNPYRLIFSQTNRDEAELAHCRYMARKAKIDVADVVYEPKLTPITCGLFKDVFLFTKTPIFLNLIHSFLRLATLLPLPGVRDGKAEVFVQFLLHLIHCAILQDDLSGIEDGGKAGISFSTCVFTMETTNKDVGRSRSVAEQLSEAASLDAYKGLRKRFDKVFHHLEKKCPREYNAWIASRYQDEHPSTTSIDEDSEKAKRKLQARARQAYIMKSMQERQKKFFSDQGEVDQATSVDQPSSSPEEGSYRGKVEFPSGLCIYCREETCGGKLFGTTVFITSSKIFRQTPTGDVHRIREVLESPSSMDVDAGAIRPFGISGQRDNINGAIYGANDSCVSKGFPVSSLSTGTVVTGCGHLLHFDCYERFLIDRKAVQLAFPDETQNEFFCSLCRTLCNSLLPVVWKPQSMSYPGLLRPEVDFETSVATMCTHATDSVIHRLTNMSMADHLRKSVEILGTYSALRLVDFWAKGHQRLMQQVVEIAATMEAEASQGPTSRILPGVFHKAYLAARIDKTHELSNDITGLRRAYMEFQQTIISIPIDGDSAQREEAANQADSEEISSNVLAGMLSSSITTVEIAQRGVGCTPGLTLVDTVSRQNLTRLRVMSETVLTFLAVGGPLGTVPSLCDTAILQGLELFAGDPLGFEYEPARFGYTEMTYPMRPLLLQDPFIFFTKASVFMIPYFNLDPYHVMRLCYVAELLRVLLHLQHPSTQTSECNREVSEELAELTRYLDGVLRMSGFHLIQNRTELGTMKPCVELVKPYMLAFVRKCTILMHVRYGIEFPHDHSSTPDEEELSRLSRILRLPCLGEIVAETRNSQAMRQLVTSWLSHWHKSLEAADPLRFQPQIWTELGHPAIFELVGLPLKFDSLQVETSGRRCPTSGLVLIDPVLCLMCGEIFCCHTCRCAAKVAGRTDIAGNERGNGPKAHLAKCSGRIGIFLKIHQCIGLFLYDMGGGEIPAPYLDRYGESDPLLSRGHQLFLKQERYDKLFRDVWLDHQCRPRSGGRWRDSGWWT